MHDLYEEDSSIFNLQHRRVAATTVHKRTLHVMERLRGAMVNENKLHRHSPHPGQILGHQGIAVVQFVIANCTVLCATLAANIDVNVVLCQLRIWRC